MHDNIVQARERNGALIFSYMATMYSTGRREWARGTCPPPKLPKRQNGTVFIILRYQNGYRTSTNIYIH